MNTVTVDQDARWKEIQEMSRRIAYGDDAPSVLESALCGAVVRAQELEGELATLKAEVAGGAYDSANYARVERNPAKLWLWRNHVDGRPEYWAFDNPYPIHTDNDDPQTLGEPCGYALVKPSRHGRPDVPEAEVLARIKSDASKEQFPNRIDPFKAGWNSAIAAVLSEIPDVESAAIVRAMRQPPEGEAPKMARSEEPKHG